MKRRMTKYFIVLGFIGAPKDGITNAIHSEVFSRRSTAKKEWERLYKGTYPFYCLKETTITEMV